MWGNLFKKKEKKPVFIHKGTQRLYTKTGRYFIQDGSTYVECLSTDKYSDWILEKCLIAIQEKSDDNT